MWTTANIGNLGNQNKFATAVLNPATRTLQSRRAGELSTLAPLQSEESILPAHLASEWLARKRQATSRRSARTTNAQPQIETGKMKPQGASAQSENACGNMESRDAGHSRPGFAINKA